MALKCPVPGCEDSEREFQKESALKSHIRNKHPEYEPEGGGAREVPIVEDDFALLLRKFKIKADLAANIAENISHTGGATVFEEPELLLKRMASWSSDIPPGKRKNIMEQWFAERQIGIPPEVQQKAGMTKEQLGKVEEETKGSAEVRYVYDESAHIVRMAKKDERGGTLSQAKELLKMADEREKEGTESPFMQDGEGRWVLNPKARVTGVELMAVQFMQQAQQKGEPVDPITAMTRAAETWKTLREGLGGGPSTQPAWMTDPVAFVGAIKTITGQEGLGGGASAQPAWMTDPAEFITMIKAITGEAGGDSALKEALAEMRHSVDEMKEQRYQDQFTGQQKQIHDITNILKQTLDTIADLKKGSVGRSEMDIIHEVATGGMDFLKTELPGMRRDIKEAFSSAGLPAPKSGEEREVRKKQTRKALQTDQAIEEIGKRMFFPQG